MLSMILGWRVAGIPRTMRCPVLFTLFFSLLPVLGFSATRWNSVAAARAFQVAQQKKSEIAQASQPTLAQYLECARTYRNVYLSDPHFSRAGDAIYEEGIIYQEAGDRFSKPEYYRTAANRFHLLVKDYGGNRSCPEALIRLGTIYSKLNDDSAAQEAYRYLKTQYKYSSQAIQRIRSEAVTKTAGHELATAPAQPESTPKIEPNSGSRSTVQNIRFWSNPEYTRVIIDLDSDAKYEKTRMADPDRICFDISNAKLNNDLLNRVFKIGDEVLKQIRLAQNRPDTVRMVLDTSATPDLSVSELHDPFRIVIDLRRKGVPAQSARQSNSTLTPKPDSEPRRREPPMAVTQIQAVPEKGEAAVSAEDKAGQTDQESHIRLREATPDAVLEPEPKQPPVSAGASSFSVSDLKPATPAVNADSVTKAPAAKPEQSSLPQQASPTSHGDRTLTRTLGLKVGRIVIDPGHGGHDFGTIGPSGLLEKDLVLSLARGLKKMLQDKIGAEVFLTRDSDTFISLEERTAIANQHKADLFISIHANSSLIHSISGVETYYLDFAKTDAEREIAARENATTVNNVRDLEDLIKKIAKADKSTESRELASIIQKRLYSGAHLVFPSAKNRGVRSAPFIVLIGANMPSVLAEVAFISNPKDESLLTRESTKQSLVKALYTGIEGYMTTLGTEVVRNQNTGQSK